jgi:hypothetical protein
MQQHCWRSNTPTWPPLISTLILVIFRHSLYVTKRKPFPCLDMIIIFCKLQAHDMGPRYMVTSRHFWICATKYVILFGVFPAFPLNYKFITLLCTDNLKPTSKTNTCTMYNIKILYRIRCVCKNYINLHGHRTWFLHLNMAMENFSWKTTILPIQELDKTYSGTFKIFTGNL